MTPSSNSVRARDRMLDLIDTALAAATVLSLAGAIALSQADLPGALYLLGVPVATIALWACSGLVIDRQALRGG